MPIPNPQDWADLELAGMILGCSKATVRRMTQDGRLTPYSAGATPILWIPEVRRLAEARRTARKKVLPARQPSIPGARP